MFTATAWRGDNSVQKAECKKGQRAKTYAIYPNVATCGRCGKELRRVGWFRNKGYKCKGCQGVFVRFRYLAHKEELERRFAGRMKKARDAPLSCIECGETMKTFPLGRKGVELDYCPRDYNIWFDAEEPDEFLAWARKAVPPQAQWRNPKEPSDAAIMAAVYFSGGLDGGFDGGFDGGDL